MARKKKSEEEPGIEALPSGERVQIHDDGKRHLIPSPGRVHERIVASAKDIHEGQAELERQHQDRVDLKREAQQRAGLPGDKSPW